ncbi:hypothetical protein [Mycolicibacterium nivoides]|uniref:hypothetical protein n=1 Tax=Mycolicibacterium nivoides TaxID=2487344 RepID=UPI003C2BA331
MAQQGVSPTVGAYLRGYRRAEPLDDKTVRITNAMSRAAVMVWGSPCLQSVLPGLPAAALRMSSARARPAM